jgi:hypothetical protein
MADRSVVPDVHGAARLAVDLTVFVTEVVETMHHNIARRRGPLAQATLAPTSGITGLVYRSVRGITRLVGSGLDVALKPLAARAGGPVEWAGRESVVAVLNGVLGDRLEATGNPLAMPMEFRVGGVPLVLEREHIAARLHEARERLIVMVHGLCMSDASWRRGTHDHGASLAQHLDATVVYLRYNSGRHISTNGAEFAALLQQLCDAWPVAPRELVLVGHSMGALLIRSACAVAQAAGHGWLQSVRALAFIGAPHQGAPLERAGHGLHTLLTASRYTAAFGHLARLRSAGITDLRHGWVNDEDWIGRDRFAHARRPHRAHPLPDGIPAFAIAGSSSRRAPAHGKARGDGLIPVASALGRHADPALDLHIPPSHTAIVYGTGHLDLLGSRTVYRRLQRWLAAALGGPAPERRRIVRQSPAHLESNRAEL